MVGDERYLKRVIETDALHDRKMAFISGPRQVGKTTLAKHVLQSPESWDKQEFRRAWFETNGLDVGRMLSGRGVRVISYERLFSAFP